MTTPEDHAALSLLVDQYCDGVITKDADRWGATWAEDGTWDLGRGEIVGRDEIVAFWKTAMERFDYVVQTSPLKSFFVEPGAETGTGRVVCQERMRMTDGTTASMVALYHDEYRRTDEGWRFGSRRLEILDRS